jgi:hypothetical protein
MSAPLFPSLGPSTVNRKWMYEINTNTLAAPVFTVLGGVLNAQFQPDTPNWVNNTDQEGKGFQSQNKTGATWSGDITVDRKIGKTDPTTYDVAQEYLRTHAIGKFGPLNTVEIRVYEYDPSDPTGVSSPRIEAYHGFCGVSWVPAGGDMLADDEVKITLNGQGQLDIIAHPYAAAPAVPVIDSATPLALPAAGGTLVVIHGRGFTGTVPTTGVKFIGTNATSWVVQDDHTIVATAPAHAAGSGAIVVTNATGPSTTGPVVTYS